MITFSVWYLIQALKRKAQTLLENVSFAVLTPESFRTHDCHTRHMQLCKTSAGHGKHANETGTDL